MKTYRFFSLAMILSLINAHSAINVTVTQGEESDLAVLYSSDDLIHNLIATELSGDHGWHEAVTDPLDKLPAFTDGEGIRATGLTGLLNDFPGAGLPAKKIEYALAVPADILEIRVFTGNNGRDGRVFHTYTVEFSSDWGLTFTEPVYVQSHPSGTLNSSLFNNWRVALSQLTDDAGWLAQRVTHIRFDFYSVDNTGGQMRDPFEELNPFTGEDDGLSAAFVSPLVWEIDVIGEQSVPEIGVTRSGDALQLSWIADTQFQVQGATNVAGGDWLDLSPQPPVTANGTTNTATLPIEAGNWFFRLRREQ
jgi:hypothetical protein